LAQKKRDQRNAQNPQDADDLLEKQLEAIGIAGGFCRFLSCDSTNNVLKQLSQSMILHEIEKKTAIVKAPNFEENFEAWFSRAMAPDSLPFVVTSDEQTAGRGRQNNTWWTGHGSLALSMLLDAKDHGLKPQASAQLSLAIGFAAMQALRSITEETLENFKSGSSDSPVAMPKIEIRWPNDVYVNDRKITGILIEAPNMRHIVIGIGVNTNSSAADAPEEIRDRIITLSDALGWKIDQNHFIFLLCKKIMEILGYFPSQIPQLIENVESNLHQIGKTVNISRENEHISGQCLGLNADGSLRVMTESGEKAVVSGVIL
jgi:BirA family biotin operon repressor/biotin-[acetyl-CoA-carboxylase] ligase